MHVIATGHAGRPRWIWSGSMYDLIDLGRRDGAWHERLRETQATEAGLWLGTGMKGWLAYWLRRIADWLTPSRPALSEIVTMTLRNRSKDITDRLTHENELMRKLEQQERWR